MAVVIDTSFLLAAMFNKDENHTKARETIRNLKVIRIVPAPVVYELFYMTTVRIGYDRAITAFESLQNRPYHIEALTPADMRRMVEQPVENREHQTKLFLVSSPVVSSNAVNCFCWSYIV
jgi:predicted nucleic acid-binding protein